MGWCASKSRWRRQNATEAGSKILTEIIAHQKSHWQRIVEVDIWVKEFVMIRKANEAYTGAEIYSLNARSSYRWACSGIESRHVGWPQYTVSRKCAQEQTLKYLRSQSKRRGISKGQAHIRSEEIIYCRCVYQGLTKSQIPTLLIPMSWKCQVMLDIRTWYWCGTLQSRLIDWLAEGCFLFIWNSVQLMWPD